MSESKKVGLLLKITAPDGSVRDLEIDKDSVILGSGASANVRLTDPSVSSIHMMLKVQKNGEVHAIDLGSENGTRLSGKALVDPTALSSGDVLELGSTKVRVGFGTAGATELVEVPAFVSEGETTEPEAVVAPVQQAAPAAPPPKRAAPPPPPAAKREKRAASAVSQGSLLGGLQGRSAASLFYEELPPEERPSATDCALDIALIWGDAIIEAGQFKSGNVKIGGSSGNNFKVYLEGVDSHVLATIEGSQAKLSAPAGGTIVVRRGGKDEKAGTSATIGLNDRARIQLGAVEFVVRFMKPAQRLKTGFLEGMDLYFTKVLSIAVMVHVVLLAAMLITPTSEGSLTEDLFRNPNRYTKLILKKPEKKKLDLSGIKEGAKAEKEEGKFGKKEEKKAEADPSKKGAPKVDANKREEDRKKVLSSGLLGAMGPDGAASNVFGPGGLGTGINNALGGITGGAGMGSAHGVGGLGSRGTGPGGGGTGLGLGGLGTKGGGRGKGGHGSIDLGGRGKSSTRIIPGKTTVVGGLSKEVIGKVIARHWNEIKYCYEKELQKDPNLQGKVAINFVIDGSGSVSEASVQQDTMAGSSVASCMVSRVRRWRFPEPQGGGQVIVTYPWVFRSAGTGDE